MRSKIMYLHIQIKYTNSYRKILSGWRKEEKGAIFKKFAYVYVLILINLLFHQKNG